MKEPTFDGDGYPTDKTLQNIREWPTKTLADMAECMDFAGKAWSYPDYWVKEDDWPDPDFFGKPCLRYVFSAGGWSGNESIVEAIEANMMVQIVGAWSWRRGGHYEYRFPKEAIPDVKMADGQMTIVEGTDVSS